MFDPFDIRDTYTSWQVSICTLLIYALFYSTLHNATQKLYYTLFILFFWVYSGVGIGYVKGVHKDYELHYYIFLAAFSVSYRFFLLLTPRLGKVIAESTGSFFTSFTNRNWLVYSVFAAYVLAAAIPLMFPTFQLYKLISPPAPDIAAEFKARFGGGGEYDQPIRKIAANVTFLLYPFYLMGVYNFRHRLLLLIILLALPLYMNYCLVSYAGRSEIISVLLIFFSIVWFYNQKLRKFLVVASFVLAPLLLSFSYYYTQLRAGEKVKTTKSLEKKVSNVVIFVETSFPTFSRKIFDRENDFNIKNFYFWFVTLPIPKVLIGKVPPASPTADIAEILLGKRMGTPGFFILLTGLVTESVYIYGKNFSFIHAIIIALVLSLLARLTEGNPILFSLTIVYALLMGYSLNRAGFVGPMAIVINQFFSFYLLVLFLVLKRLISLSSK